MKLKLRLSIFWILCIGSYFLYLNFRNLNFILLKIIILDLFISWIELNILDPNTLNPLSKKDFYWLLGKTHKSILVFLILLPGGYLITLNLDISYSTSLTCFGSYIDPNFSDLNGLDL